MKMKKILRHIKFGLVLLPLGIAFSCSLDEYNPGGFTMDNVAKTKDGYQALVNQCYFAFERYFDGSANWVHMTEGNTDLWTSQANQNSSSKEWFWFDGTNTSYTANYWNGTYDGIGSCNSVIERAHLAPRAASGVQGYTEEEINYRVAQARFMRAIYYFNAVRLWGGITLVTKLQTSDSIKTAYAPARASQMKIYEEVIIPDLKYALEWLDKGEDKTNTLPTKKAALGYLAKACLQTVEFDPQKKYAADALRYAEMLIEDTEAGGAKYGGYLYPTYGEVFAQANNQANREALWKHRWYSGPDGHGSSKGAQVLNQNVEYFYCKYDNFGARPSSSNDAVRITWGGNVPGNIMPTQHLMSLFVQSDGSLDPRFHQSFQTEWMATANYIWGEGEVNRYDRDGSVQDKKLNKGTDLAIKFIMPQDTDYVAESANKLKRDYLVVDYKDVYNDAAKNVKMRYAYQNPRGDYKGDGSNDNLFRYFYPSLTKFNSSNYYVVRAYDRVGNLNSILIMRMAEVYLIAAEAEFYVNGATTKALNYLNKTRVRAGALPFEGPVTLRKILDERGAELCGESTRFFDLKRTGMYKDASYLTATHPDLAPNFKPEYALRPIPTAYLNILEGGGAYYQNPGYN
jgi:hypothetical protein